MEIKTEMLPMSFEKYMCKCQVKKLRNDMLNTFLLWRNRYNAKNDAENGYRGYHIEKYIVGIDSFIVLADSINCLQFIRTRLNEVGRQLPFSVKETKEWKDIDSKFLIWYGTTIKKAGVYWENQSKKSSVDFWFSSSKH